MNMTRQFKNKEPKIGIFTKEEKRIRDLRGPKKDVKYQIKLNEVILDKAARSKS